MDQHSDQAFGSAGRKGRAAPLLAALLAVLLFWPCRSVASPIYVYTEPDGVVRFTTKKPPPGVQAKVFTARNTSYSVYGARSYDSRLFSRYREIIYQAAARHGLEASLVKGVIHAESAFNPRAVSPKGAMGLMQLMPAVARELGVQDPFVPHENIHGGVRHLARLIRKYNGNRALALAAYNAGEGAVERFNGIPPFPETQQYVNRVLRLANRYRIGSHG